MGAHTRVFSRKKYRFSDFINLSWIVFLVVLGTHTYDSYREKQFLVYKDLIYGEQNYRLKQVSAENILCTDSNNELCACGHCR